MSTAITEVQTAVAEFDKVAAGIQELKTKFGGVVYDVAIGKGMEAAKEARAAIREPRYEIERVRKAAKAPILALGKELDGRAKQITDELIAIEGPIDEQIKNEEARKEREKQAKIDAEIARVARIQESVAHLRGNQTLTPASGSALLADHISDLEALPVDESYEEFRPQAEATKAAGLERLRGLHEAAVTHEAEQARIKAEREELAHLRAQQAKREEESRAETARLRAEEEKRAEAERARIREEERAARAERDAEAAKVAEENRARQAELDRIEAEKQAEWDRKEAEAVAERQRLADAQAEIDRREAALAEARKPKPRKKAVTRPTDKEIVGAIAEKFSVTPVVAVEWILTLDLSNPEALAA